MATATTNYPAVEQFLAATRLRECFTAPPGAPAWLADTVASPPACCTTKRCASNDMVCRRGKGESSWTRFVIS
jgi:hypothetical protein